MKKSPAKIADVYDLELHWSPVLPASASRTEEHASAPRRVEEYLDFLEEVVPIKPDNLRVKIYKERFTL